MRASSESQEQSTKRVIRALWVGTFLIVLPLLAIHAACAPRRVATLQKVINRQGAATTGAARGVRVTREGKDLAAELGMELRTGDRIVTDTSTQAAMALDGGLEIRFDANSDATISRGFIFLERGKLFLSAARQAFRVKTKLVDAGMEGTKFVVSVGSGDVVWLAVLEGTVKVESKTKSWSARSLRELEQSTIRGTAEPQTSRLEGRTLEDIRRWIQDFERPVQKEGGGAGFDRHPERSVPEEGGGAGINRHPESPSVETGPKGSLMVSGLGATNYYVYKPGEKDEIAWTGTNGTVELLPGPYRVGLHGMFRDVTVTAGQKIVVPAGSLVVSGPREGRHDIYDASDQKELVSSASANEVTELLPGTYVVRLQGRKVTVQVRPGQKTTLKQ